MKTKFTKGKWKTVNESDFIMIAVNDDEGMFVAKVPKTWENNKANAKLIAAAPIMFEALLEISEGKGRYNMDKLIHASNTIEDMKELAIEAIKKATE